MASTTPIKGHKTADGDLTANKFISTVATGTAPFTVTSTTLVTNLNADLLDGNHASAFLQTSLTEGQFLRSDITDFKTSGDLVFSGANLIMNDNKILVFGTGNDMFMLHDGSNNLFNLKTSNLLIQDNGTTRFTFGRTSGNFIATGTGVFQGTGDSSFVGNLGVGVTPTAKLHILLNSTETVRIDAVNGVEPWLYLRSADNNSYGIIQSSNKGLKFRNAGNNINWLVIDGVAGAAVFNNSVTATGQLISTKAQNNGVIFENSAFVNKTIGVTNTTGVSTIALRTSASLNQGYSMSANRRGTDGTADMVWYNHHNSSVGVKKMTLTKEGDLIVTTGNIQGINKMRKTITNVNAAFTIIASDAGVVRKVTANSFNITVDSGSLDNIGETAEIDNFGSGTITIVAGTATLRVNGKDTLVMDGQYSRIAIQKMTSTDYRVFGQLTLA